MSVSAIFAGGVWTWLHRIGGPGLLLIGIVDGSAIPVPGSVDVFLILLAANHREWWPYYAVMATLGAVTGGYFTYRLGEKGGKEMLEKKIGKQKAEPLYQRFERRAFASITTAALLPPPFPTFPIVLAAGALQYPQKNFLAALSTGRAIRYFTLAYVAHLYGNVIIGELSRYYQPLLYGLIGVGVLGGMGALVYFKWYRPRLQREERARGESLEQFPLPLKRHR